MKKILPLLFGLLLIYSCSTSDDSGEVPLAPTELVGSGISQTQSTISWKDNSTNESGFKIERRTISGNYEIIGAVNADVLTFTDTNLTPSTYYVYRVYSINAKGKSLTYSNELIIQTIDPVLVETLTVTTSPPSSILITSAACGAVIATNNQGNITQRGVVWSTSPNPTVDLPTKTLESGLSFISTITGLTASTTYYIRAYASNDVGNVYGQEYNFTTLPLSVPILVTSDGSLIYTNMASSGGSIANDGGGPITARGVVWSTSYNPTTALSTKTIDGTGLGTFESVLTGLIGSTTYYIRAYATNSVGTGYGNEVSFTTLPLPDSVTDIDGNTYQTVRIGTQIWTITNLNVAHYRNGDPILQVTDANKWMNNITIGAWCYYENNSANGTIYGKLYNWYSVNDPRGLAPVGYHIPSAAEWYILVDYLGGIDVTGGKMKATTGWSSPNTAATNSSGFTGLAGGLLTRLNGLSHNIGSYGHWWSQSELDAYNARDFFLYFNYGSILSENDAKGSGFSVRCVKD